MMKDKKETEMMMNEMDMEKVTGGTDENPDLGLPDDEKRPPKPGRPGAIMK